jgi:hypothetical protein
LCDARAPLSRASINCTWYKDSSGMANSMNLQKRIIGSGSLLIPVHIGKIAEEVDHAMVLLLLNHGAAITEKVAIGRSKLRGLSAEAIRFLRGFAIRWARNEGRRRTQGAGRK